MSKKWMVMALVVLAGCASTPEQAKPDAARLETAYSEEMTESGRVLDVIVVPPEHVTVTNSETEHVYSWARGSWVPQQVIKTDVVEKPGQRQVVFTCEHGLVWSVIRKLDAPEALLEKDMEVTIRYREIRRVAVRGDQRADVGRIGFDYVSATPKDGAR